MSTNRPGTGVLPLSDLQVRQELHGVAGDCYHGAGLDISGKAISDFRPFIDGQ